VWNYLVHDIQRRTSMRSLEARSVKLVKHLDGVIRDSGHHLFSFRELA